MAIEIVPTGSREGGGGMDIENKMSETSPQSMQPMEDTMPRFDTLSADRQMEILNLFPDMERNQIMALMETGLTFEDALEEMNRMFQNPPPQLRQDEMDMIRDAKNMPFSTDEDARMLQDAKDPQTGMPIRKFDFTNKSGALGAFGGEMPMRPTEDVQEMMRRRNKQRNM